MKPWPAVWEVLAVLLLLVVARELQAQHVTTGFVSTHMFGDHSALHMTKHSHWIFHDTQIQHQLSITVSEAYFGCSKEITYKRLIQNPDCQVTNCAYCKNKGVIHTKTINKDRLLQQNLQSPCPVCLGKLKAGKDGCKIYIEKAETVTFDIPRGSRLGFEVVYPRLGNAMLDYTTPGNFSFTTGDLLLSVGEITDPTASGLNMTSEGLEINVIMQPVEALEGFTRRYDYFNGKVINIDKINKTTLPDTEIIMDDDFLAHSQTSGRKGLLIRFTMLSIDELKSKLAEDFKKSIPKEDETTVITSQDDFDEWAQTKKDLRKQFKRDCIITTFLWDIKRRQDAEKSDDGYDDDDDDSPDDESNDELAHNDYS